MLEVLRSVSLFATAAIAEIGGAFLVWQGIREGKGAWTALAGALALFVYGVLATLQVEPRFGRVLAAYGGVFVVGSLLWAMALDNFRPNRSDIVGAAVCLVGVGLIMYGPRGD
jgi:small multidrug resistance family-3 protein